MPASITNFYQLLGIEASASPEDVRRAFRQQIAKYHPDKVQHLGKEFQDMAAGRAAALTEAYRVLSDAGRRAEHDRALAAAAPEPARAPAAAAPVPPVSEPAPASAKSAGPAFSQERASRDEFVRKAAIGRFRQVLAQATGGGYDEAQARGFDVAWAPKGRLFARSRDPRLLGRFVPRVDARSIAAAWTDASRAGAASGEPVCVFLMGSAMAPAPELAGAIADQRRKDHGARVAVIPIDARDWRAHVPTDAPAVARTILGHLRECRS